MNPFYISPHKHKPIFHEKMHQYHHKKCRFLNNNTNPYALTTKNTENHKEHRPTSTTA